jgi:hypothetical protein
MLKVRWQECLLVPRAIPGIATDDTAELEEMSKEKARRFNLSGGRKLPFILLFTLLNSFSLSISFSNSKALAQIEDASSPPPIDSAEAGNQDNSESQKAKPKETTKSEPKWAKLIDLSGRFQYEIPDGWNLTRNPFLPNDILVQPYQERQKTIFFELKKGRLNEAKARAYEKENLAKLEESKLINRKLINTSTGPGYYLELDGLLEGSPVKEYIYLRKLGSEVLAITGCSPLKIDKNLEETLGKVNASIVPKHVKMPKRIIRR